MDDETKQLIRDHLHLLREHTSWCVHDRNEVCAKCKVGIIGDLSNIRGNLSGVSGNLTDISGDLSNIRGDFTDIKATADEINRVLQKKEQAYGESTSRVA